MIADAPDGYELSKREELGPLVRDFHEMVDRDLTDGELLALDFALEWTFEWAEAEMSQKAAQEKARFTPEYGVTYGVLPNVRMMNMPSLEIARKVAVALRGQVRVRQTGQWELWRGVEE